MNLTIGQEVFRKNAGIITAPADYEFHWLCEFKDGTQLEMFDSSGLARGKRPFQEVSKDPSRVSHVIWKSLVGDFHFGVNFNNKVPTFMVNNQLYMPVDSKFYNGSNFVPHFFIRNSVPIKAGTGGAPEILHDQKEMIYFAGYYFSVKDTTVGMFISFNGRTLACEGFSSFEICGGYKLT